MIPSIQNGGLTDEEIDTFKVNNSRSTKQVLLFLYKFLKAIPGLLRRKQ